MIGLLKYRIVAFSLAAVFGVFNIGIPILIASCPMVAMMQGRTCPMCDDQDSPTTSKISTEQSTSCCATTIVAERNTNEFVQTKERTLDSTHQLTLAESPVFACNVLAPASTVFQTSPSPPTAVDIPILISSLLI